MPREGEASVRRGFSIIADVREYWIARLRGA